MDVQQQLPPGILDLITGATAPLFTPSFWGVALAISVLMTCASKTVKALRPGLIQDKWAHVAFTWANPLLGCLMAIPAGFLTGDTYLMRCIWGLVAGGFSHTVYKLVLKRFKFFAGSDKKESTPSGRGD